MQGGGGHLCLQTATKKPRSGSKLPPIRRPHFNAALRGRVRLARFPANVLYLILAPAALSLLHKDVAQMEIIEW